MNRKELLKQIDLSVKAIKKELKEGDIKGCLIWIREGRKTEIQTY